jgi:hypothetical protein
MVKSIRPNSPLGGTVVEVPREVKTTARQVNTPDGKKKGPAFRRDPSAYSSINFVRPGSSAALLARILARTVRVLLLLAGFVTTALLLAGLLARVLLARILVLAGHQELPFACRGSQPGNRQLVAVKRRFRRALAGGGRNRGRNLPLYKRLDSLCTLLPPRVPTVKKMRGAPIRLPGPSSPRYELRAPESANRTHLAQDAQQDAPNGGSVCIISPSN